MILALAIGTSTGAYANRYVVAKENPSVIKLNEVKITLNLGNITHLKKSEVKQKIKDLLNSMDQFGSESGLSFKVNVKATADSKELKNLQIEASVSGKREEVKKEVKSLSNILFDSMKELTKIELP